MLVEFFPIVTQAVENLSGPRVFRVDFERLFQLTQASLGASRLNPKFCGPMREIPCNDGANLGFGSVVYWVRLVKVGG